VLIEQPPKAKEALTVIDRPGAVQSQVRMGHIAVPRNHPDYYPLLMCNAILGGLFNSRINMNLREDKGYTYGARSRFDFRVGPGPFVVSTGVHTEVTGPALREIVKEIALIRADVVRPDELQAAITRYSLSLPGQFQTVEQTANMFGDLFIHDLPLDYYTHLPSALAKVTAAEVLRVAREHLDPNNMTVVIVGDKTKVEPTLMPPNLSTKI
jgi:zinc protease